MTQISLENYTRILESQNIIAWIFNHGIKTERNIPLSFARHSFMIDPYLDWTPEQGVRKASQCGWSTMTNFKLFYSAKFGIPEYGIPAANVIYTLPSDQDVNAFVPSKTNLMIKNNQVIQDYLRDENGKVDTDSIQRKKIDQSMVYFKGTRSKTAALMLSSDLNIHDESDRSEQSIIGEYESRLANSMYKGRWIFSNPSAPNMPADLMFLDSDQKHWFIKCEHCGHWQYLDWVKLSEHEFKKATHCYVDDTNGLYVCGSCSLAITDENRLRGRWVRKYRDKRASGYWVSHFMYSWIPAADIIAVERKKSKAYFMNFVRGLPYIGSDVKVDSQVIVNNIVLDSERKWTPGKVAMGVDNGDVKHVVIGDSEGIFKAFTTKSWDDVEFAIQKYQPVTVIDLNPYPAKARELAKKYRPIGDKRWRVYCSFYIEQSKNYELIDWGEGEKAHMVYPVRELLFDDLVAYIANGNMKFFAPKSYWEEYIAQWETMYKADFVGTRRADEVGLGSPQPQARAVWLSSTGNDHYAHATLYYYVALSKIIAGGGQILKQPDNLSQVKKELGGIPVVPDITDGKMTQKRSYIPDLSKLGQLKKGSGAVSDKV